MFLLALKQQRFCLARNNQFARVMEHVLKGERVYVKNTGVAVLVTDFNHHRHQKKNFIVQIRFEDVPNKKSIELCDSFHVRVHKNGPRNTLGGAGCPVVTDVTVDAQIALNLLSDLPYNTKAGKTLYKKVNK